MRRINDATIKTTSCNTVCTYTVLQIYGTVQYSISISISSITV